MRPEPAGNGNAALAVTLLIPVCSFLQMRRSMNTAAVKRRRKRHLSKKESRGNAASCSLCPDNMKKSNHLSIRQVLSASSLLTMKLPPPPPTPHPPCSSIVNVPGESTLRRDFIRLQQENKERSEALRRQQLLQEQQLREQEEYKRQLLAERQKRIEQQKEQRRRLEEVSNVTYTVQAGKKKTQSPQTTSKETRMLSVCIIYQASQNPPEELN